ncbi:MAG: hypothetical protein HY323_07185 [Betaproteobacteria bacterium]|nr:hypothetical protein [Betaproteobacteria bacterium]
MTALQDATREEMNSDIRVSKTARLRRDVVEAVDRFGVDDMRGSWSNALEALVVAGLESMRRRKPLVRGLEVRAIEAPDPESPPAA